MINIEKLTPNTSKELLTILSFCEDKILNSIPKTFMEKINELASYSNKDFYINKNKELKDQELSEECKILLTDIYNSYIANDITLEEVLDYKKENN